MSNKTHPLTEYEIKGLIRDFSTHLVKEHEDMPLSDAYSNLKDKHVLLKIEHAEQRRKTRVYQKLYLDAMKRLHPEEPIGECEKL